MGLYSFLRITFNGLVGFLNSFEDTGRYFLTTYSFLPNFGVGLVALYMLVEIHLPQNECFQLETLLYPVLESMSSYQHEKLKHQ